MDLVTKIAHVLRWEIDTADVRRWTAAPGGAPAEDVVEETLEWLPDLGGLSAPDRPAAGHAPAG